MALHIRTAVKIVTFHVFSSLFCNQTHTVHTVTIIYTVIYVKGAFLTFLKNIV